MGLGHKWDEKEGRLKPLLGKAFAYLSHLSHFIYRKDLLRGICMVLGIEACNREIHILQTIYRKFSGTGGTVGHFFIKSLIHKESCCPMCPTNFAGQTQPGQELRHG